MATNGSSNASLTKYCSYTDPTTGTERIGHLDGTSIQPLAFKSGTPISNLYQVIQIGEVSSKCTFL